MIQDRQLPTGAPEPALRSFEYLQQALIIDEAQRTDPSDVNRFRIGKS